LRGTPRRIENIEQDQLFVVPNRRSGKGSREKPYSWYTMLDAQTTKADTRTRILEVAESAVLAKGFASTSIEEIIAAVGITKSGFFYHFKDKGALAKGLILRYLEHDKQVLEDIFRRGDELNDDPLHGFLVGLKLFAEMLGNMAEAHPGCLVASFCYQEQLFNREIRELNAGGVLIWRKRFRDRLDLIAKRYPPRQDTDFEALARQMLLYRDFIKAVFLGVPAT